MYPTKEQLEDRWWNRLVKVLIILVTVASFVFAIYTFANEFRGSPQFLLSFESGYSEVKAEEQKLEDYPPSLSVINRIKKKNPKVLSKNSFSVRSFSLYPRIPYSKEPIITQLYPKEFIETQCKGELLSYSPESFGQIVENYPDWRIKSWTPKDYSVFLVFLIVPIIYFGLWFIYKKIILYIVFGKKHKTK